MNKAWVLLPALLAIACGTKSIGGTGGEETKVSCSPESDALKFLANGDALSAVLGTWNVCDAGASGTRLDGIQISASGWQGLRLVGGDLVADYTVGGSSVEVTNPTFPSTLIFLKLWRWGGGSYSTSVRKFTGSTSQVMDMEFTNGEYAGGIMVPDKAGQPPSGDCRPSMKPFLPDNGNSLTTRLNGVWQICDGVGPFPRNFDGVEFYDGRFYAMTDDGSGTLKRDPSFSETFTVVDNTATGGKDAWNVSITGNSGSAMARALVYPQSQPRLYLANGDTYWGVYKKVQ